MPQFDFIFFVTSRFVNGFSPATGRLFASLPVHKRDSNESTCVTLPIGAAPKEEFINRLLFAQTPLFGQILRLVQQPVTQINRGE